MDEQQECQVAYGLQEGRVEAWHALYDAYAKRVWHCVARLMEPHALEVADVVQETFLSAARSASNYDPSRGSLWAWLSGIARNCVAVHYRQKRRHDPLVRADGNVVRQIGRWLDGGPEPPETFASAELAVLVRQTLTELPSDYEILLTAKYVGEATIEEIARQQNCSAAAISSRLARARRAFRRAFVKAHGHPSDPSEGERHES